MNLLSLVCLYIFSLCVDFSGYHDQASLKICLNPFFDILLFTYNIFFVGGDLSKELLLCMLCHLAMQVDVPHNKDHCVTIQYY